MPWGSRASCRACLSIRIRFRESQTSLFPDDRWHPRLQLAARAKRQVLAHHIDNHACNHRQHGDPDTPITMCTSPVKAMVVLSPLVIRPTVHVLTLLIIIHCFPAFSVVIQICFPITRTSCRSFQFVWRYHRLAQPCASRWRSVNLLGFDLFDGHFVLHAGHSLNIGH